jgi:hypothetical protein
LQDRFECVSEREHVYDWAFHAEGRLTTSLPLEPRDGPLGADNGYQHIQNVATAVTDEAWWARWDAGEATLTLHFAAEPGTQVFTGLAPGRNPAQKVPVLVVRRRARSTTFEVTHEVSVRER